MRSANVGMRWQVSQITLFLSQWQGELIKSLFQD
jgi:hypothetical protein